MTMLSEFGLMDPRPDRVRDGYLWLRVLRAAFDQDGNDPHSLYGLLHGVRCCGAILERRPDRLYIRRGVADEGDWAACRAALEERRDEVVTILEEALE